MNAQLKLGEIITQTRGVSYKPSDVRAAGDPDAVALLRANNIQEDGLNFDDLVWVDKHKVSAEQYLRMGDILICSSSGSKGLVGKAAIVTNDLSCAFGAFCKVVRTKAEYASYLGQFFRSPRYRKEISASAAGANINNIRNKHIDDMFISMPSENERAGCVAKLGQIDYLIQKSNNQTHQLDQLVKSRFVEMFGEPEFNNKQLEIKPLGELCNVGSSKRIYQSEQTEEGIPFLRISDLLYKMDTGNDSCDLYIPVARYDELAQQGLVPVEGDILLTARGTLGRCYIVQADDRFYFQDGMISWLSRYAPTITPIYIAYLFQMKGFRKQIDEMQAGSTVAYLSIDMTKKLKVMLPPLELQNRFAAFVAEVDKSKLAVQQSLEKLETLKKSLMQQYFG